MSYLPTYSEAESPAKAGRQPALVRNDTNNLILFLISKSAD